METRIEVRARLESFPDVVKSSSDCELSESSDGVVATLIEDIRDRCEPGPIVKRHLAGNDIATRQSFSGEPLKNNERQTKAQRERCTARLATACTPRAHTRTRPLEGTTLLAPAHASLRRGLPRERTSHSPPICLARRTLAQRILVSTGTTTHRPPQLLRSVELATRLFWIRWASPPFNPPPAAACCLRLGLHL